MNALKWIPLSSCLLAPWRKISRIPNKTTGYVTCYRTVALTPGDEVSTLHNTGFFMKWADALPAASDCIFADGFEAGGAGCGGLGM